MNERFVARDMPVSSRVSNFLGALKEEDFRTKLVESILGRDLS